MCIWPSAGYIYPTMAQWKVGRRSLLSGFPLQETLRKSGCGGVLPEGAGIKGERGDNRSGVGALLRFLPTAEYEHRLSAGAL